MLLTTAIIIIKLFVCMFFSVTTESDLVQIGLNEK